MKVYNKTEIKKINNHDLNMNVDKYSYDLNQNYTAKAVRLDILKDELLSNVEVAKFVSNEKWINVIKKFITLNPN